MKLKAIEKLMQNSPVEKNSYISKKKKVEKFLECSVPMFQ